MGQGLEALHHVLDALGLLGDGRGPGPAGVRFVGLFQKAVAEAADDVQGVADAVGHAQGHLRHGALHHQGLHLPVQGQDLVAGLLQVVVVRFHAAIQALDAMEEKGDGCHGDVDDGVEAAEDPAHLTQLGIIPVGDEILQTMGNDMGKTEDHEDDGQPVEEEPQGVFRVPGHQDTALSQGQAGKNNDAYRSGVFQDPQGRKR